MSGDAVSALPPPAGQTRQRWSVVIPHRPRLVALARLWGAGPDAEDVVHEAMLAAVRYQGLDERRPWGFLVALTARRLADVRRRAARERILRLHRGLLGPSDNVEHEVLGRAGARWLNEMLDRTVPAQVADAVRRVAAGATLAELATEYGLSTSALQTRVWRALQPVRQRLERRRMAEPDGR